MSGSQSPPVFMLPGLTRGYPVLDGLLQRVPNSQAVPLVDPLPRERLPAYAERLGNEIPADSVIVGVSFGGIAASEIAKTLKPRGLILISTVRHRTQLPRRWKLARLLTARGCSGLCHMTGKIAGLLPRGLQSVTTRRLASFAGSDGPWLRWATSEVATWAHADVASSECPTLQIHGSQDAVFPIGNMLPDVVIAGGHGIATTHSEEVAHTICCFLETLATRPTDEDSVIA